MSSQPIWRSTKRGSQLWSELPASCILLALNSLQTDETALYLIGAVSAPIAQLLVNNAVLQFTEANITNISDDGFDLSLVGSLTGTGPLDALIEFTEPVVYVA